MAGQSIKIPLRRLRTDFGLWDNSGASKGHQVDDYNGVVYQAKGPMFDSTNLHGPANELISAQIMELIKVPIPKYAILDSEQGLCFGSEVVSGPIAAQFTVEIYERSINRDDIYPMAAADIWLCNTDRHAGNVMPGRVDDGSAEPLYLLYAIDHERAILKPGQTCANLPEQDALPITDHLRALLGYLQNWDKMDEAIARIEAIVDETIEAVINNLPDKLLPPSDKEEYISFLKSRRGNLRSFVAINRNLFPYGKS